MMCRPSEKPIDLPQVACQVPAMPPRKQSAGARTETHKTTIVLPSDLYKDLKLLVALEHEGTIQSLVEKAVRELVKKESDTLKQLRRLRADREQSAAE